jgi:cobalt-zinc-cadmium efflux system protein
LIVPHSHSHEVNASNPRLGLSIALTLAFVIGEAVAGYFAHSLALMSDAGHNFSDALALALSWYGFQAARQPATSKRTFGSHRVGILAALANALTLVAIGAIIFWEAIERFRDPKPVQGGPMIWVALVAVVLNGVISLWLRQGAKHDLNLRSAYLHMLGDAFSAFGVVLAGVIVAFTGSPIADPIVSLFIGGAIIWSSWGIITESVNILLEAVPKGVDMEALEQSIKGVDGVLGVHDLHVWTVASGIHSASCHVLVSEQSIRSGEQICKAVTEMLIHDYAIGHTTIQVECQGCDADALYCTMTPVGAHDHHGHHH